MSDAGGGGPSGAVVVNEPPLGRIVLALRRADVVALVLIGAIYLLAAKLGLRLAFVHASATPVWPAAGIALAALLIRGTRMWPAIFVGAFLANVTTAGSVSTSLGIAVGNTLEAVLGTYLVTRFASGRRAFARAQDVITFFVLAALVSTLVSATIGVGTLVLAGFAPWAKAGAIWLTWWLGDAVGVVIIAPVLILWAEKKQPRRWNPSRLFEAGLLVLAVLIAGQLVFGAVLPKANPTYPIDFLAVPPLVWAAFRFGQRETATASFILAGMGIWGGLHGQGPFSRPDPNESLLLLQAFVGLSAVLALAFAALVAERKRVDEERLALIPEAEAARRIAETSERSARFLAEVSVALGASIDLDATLLRVTRMAVPLLADLCAVDLLQPDGSIRRVAHAHVDPVKEPLVRELRERWGYNPEAPSGVPAVVRTRQSVLIADAGLSELAEAATNAEQLAMLRRLGLRSWIIVPLVAHQRVLGAISFAVTESARRYGPPDLALAETVAHRAASAIENATLYAQAQAAQAEAETANRLKDEFLAMLGHELRNPLGAISNAVHILDRVDDVRGPSATQAREIISRQVQHLSGLIDDLLDVGRVMTGKIRLNRGPLDLFQAVERSLHTLSAAGKTHDHTIRLNGESVWVDGDVTRIEQVALNLLENALRYTPPGGAISIDASQQGERAVLRVEDSGAGIHPDLLPRIFDLFVQGERGADRSHGGLGIGLTLVKRLAELHGGTIEAVSAGPGMGSVFTLTLPALSMPLPASAPAPSAAVPARRVAIIEDNVDSRETLRVLFEMYGHEVHEAGDGPSGVELVLRVQPDAAFVDVGLPGFDGYEVARRIRAAPNGRRVQLIAVTGYGLPADQAQARQAGFNHHVVKPVHPNQVNSLLRDPGAGGV
ncbi:MAG TPA: MASE1 domain-containing protein [Methylomirabilota bacterium]|nr:MASE1 domain-containing protein [Methylomirabilota bacterium]